MNKVLLLIVFCVVALPHMVQRSYGAFGPHGEWGDWAPNQEQYEFDGFGE